MMAALLSMFVSASGLMNESLLGLFRNSFQELFMLHDLFVMGFSVLGLVAVVVVRRLLAEGPSDLDHPSHAPPLEPPEGNADAARAHALGHGSSASGSAMLPGATVLTNGFEL